MKRFSSLVFLSLFLLQPINSQDLDTASISGVVRDQNGAAIPGALIDVTLSKNSARRNAITDSQGRYRLIQLEPGTYTVQVNSSGFASQELKAVTIVSGQTFQ